MPALQRALNELTNRVNWRHELLAMAVAAMEVCWFTPWFLVLNPTTARHPPFLTALSLWGFWVSVSYAVRALNELNLELKEQRFLLGISIVLSLLLFLALHVYSDFAFLNFKWLLNAMKALGTLRSLLPDELVAIGVLLFAWWRGIALSQRSFNVENVSFAFRLGLVLLIWSAMMATILRGLAVGFVLAYFGAGLLAMALARVEEVSQIRGGTPSPFTVSWVGVLVVATTLLVGLGLGLSYLISAEHMAIVLQWAWPLVAVVKFVVYALLVAMVLLLYPVVNWLVSILVQSGFLANLSETLKQLAGQRVKSPFAEAGLFIVPLQYLRAALTILVILGVMGLLLLSLRRLRKRREAKAGRYLTSGQEIVQSLVSMFQNSLQQVVALAGLAARFGVSRGLLSALSIRHIYASMCRLAARRGYARRRSQTPYEYQPTLDQAFPGAEVEIARITEAYVGVHYGELPESRAALQEIRACWKRVRAKDEELHR